MQGDEMRQTKDPLDLGQQLLPGIYDEITIQQITPKLPWAAVHTLSSVSSAWRHAIRSRQVFDARVFSGSTETHVFLSFQRPGSEGVCGMALYSMRDGTCSELPPIPGYVGEFEGGFLKGCQPISLDGKLYLLGGWSGMFTGVDKVYVFDLAGERKWKVCASMKHGRLLFGCGVVKKKIYVSGGLSDFYPISESEVYDPNEDSWSPIRATPSLRFYHGAQTVGDELVMLGGRFANRERFGPTTSRKVTQGGALGAGFANFLEIYNPVEDEWRLEKPFAWEWKKGFFMARGKLHSMGSDVIHVHNDEDDSWTLLHTFVLMEPCSISVHFWDVRVVDCELLARFGWQDEVTKTGGSCLAHSRGFGGEHRQIFWENATFPYSIMTGTNSRLCTVEL